MSDVLSMMSASDKERFWAKVDIRGEGECWPWKDGANGDGYGTFSIGGRDNQKKLRPHRVALILSEGKDIDEGLYVLHSCDNPACCNPAHLSAGTHQDNMDDMKNKGRAAISFGASKLDWEKVDAIRLSKKSGKDLAAEHNVGKATISEIRNFKTWREEHRHVSKGLS